MVIIEDGLPSPEMTASEIMQAGFAHIAHEVKSMADHHRFLRSGEPSDTIAAATKKPFRRLKMLKLNY